MKDNQVFAKENRGASRQIAAKAPRFFARKFENVTKETSNYHDAFCQTLESTPAAAKAPPAAAEIYAKP